MKKTLLILVAIVFAVTACNKQTYVDGTYSVKYDAIDSHGWQAFVEFTLVEDAITEASYDYYDANMNLKSEDTAYQSRMSGIVGIGPADYTPMINANIKAATILPQFDSIDVVTGATHSCHTANELVKAGLDAAMDGEPTVIELVQPDPMVEE